MSKHGLIHPHDKRHQRRNGDGTSGDSGSKSASQSGRSYRTTRDRVTIFKPGAGATHFTARELRSAIDESRSASERAGRIINCPFSPDYR